MTEINRNRIQRSFQRLFRAKYELMICSPFISPNFLTDLIDIANTNVKVKVITSQHNKDFLRSTLWILEKFKNTPNFETKIIEKLHAKIYISDNDLAIHGSANLTDTALNSNIEQIDIVEEKDAINELKRMFDDIWQNGIEKKADVKLPSQNLTFKISKKEKAISDAKNFLLEKFQECSSKEQLLHRTREMLRACHHLNEIRLENYLNIALADLKVNHDFNMDGNPKREKAYSYEEIRQIYPNGYELWTEEEDRFLKKFWIDELNKHGKNDKIYKLMHKFGRSRGAIISRLKKMGFDFDEEIK